MCVAKTKALISYAITAQLICVFVFAHTDFWFSGAKAQFYVNVLYPIQLALVIKGLLNMVCQMSFISVLQGFWGEKGNLNFILRRKGGMHS